MASVMHRFRSLSTAVCASALLVCGCSSGAGDGGVELAGSSSIAGQSASTGAESGGQPGAEQGSGGAATGGRRAGSGSERDRGEAGTASGGAPSGGNGGGSAGDPGTCSADSCPAPNAGVTIQRKKRFMYGVNYAWPSFAGDFGGIAAWNQSGVAGAKAARTADLTQMKDNGVDIVRWWMFPDLRGDGVQLDSSGTPSGLGSSVVDDIHAALDIAASLDLHLKLTLFSFDNSGATTPTAAWSSRA
ncbi:MAG: hypothetical protein JW940_21370 [Polyangiaceae bacterium]|nr:hypothetical protein [Polyangiaceae bacterium]